MASFFNYLHPGRPLNPAINMKSKILLFLMGTIFMINAAKAQVSYGVRTGINFAKWQGEDLLIIEDLVDKTDGYLETRGKTGWHVGGYVNIPINNTFSVEPGLAYSKKGYSLMGDFQIPVLKSLGLNAGARVQSHYIDVPLVLRANLTKGLSIYTGPQASVLVRSTLNAKLGVLGINIFNRGFGITERFNRVDLGLTGGVGYQFDNGVNIQAGYDHGLSTLDKNNNYAAYNRVVKVSVGFSF